MPGESDGSGGGGRGKGGVNERSICSLLWQLRVANFVDIDFNLIENR